MNRTCFLNKHFGYDSTFALTPYHKTFLESQLGISVALYDVVTSTIDLLDKTDLRQQIVLAEYQTQGRGQRGRVWQSYFARQILLSFGPCGHSSTAQGSPDFYYHKVYQALLTFNEDLRFKAPNDIYLFDKKISGMLLEHYQGRYYCHLGLNVLPVDSAQYGALFTHDSIPPLIREKILVEIIQSLG